MNGNEQPEQGDRRRDDCFNDAKRIIYTDSSGTSYKKVSSPAEPEVQKPAAHQEHYGRPKANWAEISTAWTAGVAILISAFTLIGLYFTWKETKRTADAAICATHISAKALMLSTQQFAASEAAVLQPNISIRNIGNGPFVQVDIINSGHIAATHVNGYIHVPRHVDLRLSNVTITTHSASPEYPSGFITRTVGLGKAPLDMKALAAQHFRVSGKLDYWNGTEPIKSTFCYGLTVSPYTSAPDWQECENQQNLQQPMP